MLCQLCLSLFMKVTKILNLKERDLIPMDTEKMKQDFAAELDQNRVDVGRRRESVRAKYGKPISPERERYLKEEARIRFGN